MKKTYAEPAVEIKTLTPDESLTSLNVSGTQVPGGDYGRIFD